MENFWMKLKKIVSFEIEFSQEILKCWKICNCKFSKKNGKMFNLRHFEKKIVFGKNFWEFWHKMKVKKNWLLTWVL